MADPKPVYFWVPGKDDKTNKKKAFQDEGEAKKTAKKNGGKVYGPYFRKKKAAKK